MGSLVINCAKDLGILHSLLVSGLTSYFFPFLFFSLPPIDRAVNLLENNIIFILEADVSPFPDEMLLIH